MARIFTYYFTFHLLTYLEVTECHRVINARKFRDNMDKCLGPQTLMSVGLGRMDKTVLKVCPSSLLASGRIVQARSALTSQPMAS